MTTFRSPQPRRPCRGDYRQRSTLRSKLLRSHLLVASFGLFAVASILGLNLWTRVYTQQLVHDRIPVLRETTNLRSGAQQSLAALRGWVAIGTPSFRQDRAQTWRNTIEPGLGYLEAVSHDQRALIDQVEFELLRQDLQQLRSAQWWIEELAQTPGNEPARAKFTQEIEPISNTIFLSITNCINIEKTLPTEGRKDLLAAMADLRGFFSRSRSLLVANVDRAEAANENELGDAIQVARTTADFLLQQSPKLNKDQTALVKLIDRELNAYEILAKEVLATAHSQQWNVARYRLTTEAVPLATRVSERLARMTEQQSQFMEDTSQTIAAFTSGSVVAASIMMLGLGITAIGIANRKTRSIATPIEELSTAIGQLADGILGDDIPVTTNDELGSLTHAFNEMRVTLLRRTEELRQLEARFRTTVDSAPVAVIMADSQRNIVLLNSEAENLFGYPKQEIIGLPLATLFPDVNVERLRPENQLDQSRTGSSPDPTRREYTAKRKDGVPLPVEVGINTLTTNEGTFDLLAMLDVSVRKQQAAVLRETNQSLRESEAIYRTLIDQSVNFIGLLTVNGVVLQANRTACNAAGISPKDVIGCDFWNTPWWNHSPEKQQRLKESIQLAAQGHHIAYETDHVAPNGEAIDVAFSLTPVFDDQGNVIYLIPEGRNITQHKQREAELQRLLEKVDRSNDELEKLNATLQESEMRAQAANQAKSNFLANMSHEIRTPMTAILGFSEMLLDDEVSPGSRQKAIQTIHRNGNHLLELINDILDLSKIEADRLDLDLQVINPITILDDTLELLEDRAIARGNRLVRELISPLPDYIVTDSLRVKQALVNLIGNAIKFTKNGEVRVSAKCDIEQQQWSFVVQDTGIGMTPEHITQIFKPFGQADTSTTRAYGGTGLGLTITQRIANLLGGEVSVESELGVGSTFTLTFSIGEPTNTQPASIPNSARAEFAPTIDVGTVTLEGRVLVVEDGRDNQRLISFLLSKAGAEVTLADNGEQGLHAALEAWHEGTPYDVILMDMQMPLMDGYTATRKLREASYEGSIIALTAHAMDRDIEDCLAAGCDAYLSKPIDRSRFLFEISKRLHAAPQVASSISE